MSAALTNIAMVSEPDREIVQYVFSLRFWTPRSARTWVMQRGYAIYAMQTTEQVCIVHLRPPADYKVQSIQRTVLSGFEGISAGDALLRGSLVGR